MWSRPVCATSTTSASGAASSAASTPPGRGASTLVIASARTAIRSQPELAEPLDPPLAPTRREVAALREDHEGVVLVEPGGQRRRSASSRRSPAPGSGVMKRAGMRCSSTSIAGSQARVSLSTTRGSRCVPVHQRVDEHERVARPGVPAADQQRRAREGVRRRAVDLDASGAAPAGPRGRGSTARPARGRSGCPGSTASGSASRSPRPATARTGRPAARSRRPGRGSATQSRRSGRQRPGSSGESAAAASSHSGSVSRSAR